MSRPYRGSIVKSVVCWSKVCDRQRQGRGKWDQGYDIGLKERGEDQEWRKYVKRERKRGRKKVADFRKAVHSSQRGCSTQENG